MISPLCVVCNKPNWNVVHATSHPVNRDNPEAHDFVIPKGETPVNLGTPKLDDRENAHIVLDFIAAGVLISALVGITYLLKGMGLQ